MIALERLHDAAQLPKRATDLSFGYDLALTEATTWRLGETKIAPCGFRLGQELPTLDGNGQGVGMLIVPRSSLFLKHGLIIPNSPGLIDADYTGPIGVILWRPWNPEFDDTGWMLGASNKNLTLPVGTRVAQAVFVRMERPLVVEVERATQARQRGGFGSTGV